jgi:hypothetical protein
MTIFYDYRVEDEARMEVLMHYAHHAEHFIIADGIYNFIDQDRSRPVRLIHFRYLLETSNEQMCIEYYPEHRIEDQFYSSVVSIHYNGRSVSLREDDNLPFLMALEDQAGQELII